MSLPGLAAAVRGENYGQSWKRIFDMTFLIGMLEKTLSLPLHLWKLTSIRLDRRLYCLHFHCFDISS